MKYEDPWIEEAIPLEDEILGGVDESGLFRVLLTWSSPPSARWLMTARMLAQDWDVYRISDRGIELVTSPAALDENVKRIAVHLAEFNRSFRTEFAEEINARADLDQAISDLRIPEKGDYRDSGGGRDEG
jgi:hypothetical protein